MSQKESVDQLELDSILTENRDLRERLREARDQAYRLLDRNDKQRRELQHRRNLLGRNYRYPSICSDGRVWAAPAESAREETIRWFAGHAAGGILARGTDDETVAIEAATLIAFDLWDQLEKAFVTERDKRAAAAEVVSKVAQDETEGDDDGE